MFQPDVGNEAVICAILGGVVDEDMTIPNGWKLLARMGRAEEDATQAKIRARLSAGRGTKMYAACPPDAGDVPRQRALSGMRGGGRHERLSMQGN
jgi:hypothetical protein